MVKFPARLPALLPGLVLACGCVSTPPVPAQSPATVSEAGTLATPLERSDSTEITSHEDVVAFYRELAARSPAVRLREVGRSRAGRPIHLATIARPAVASPWQAQSSGKPIVLIVAQVHGDEPAGKEGLMLFARDLALGSLSDLLDDVVFLLVPQINPDAAEAGEWGSRSNLAGYNLNRDYLRLENPAIRTVVGVITAWRPDVIVDAHEARGPPRAYDFYTLHPANINGPHAPSHIAITEAIPAVVDALADAGYSHFPYHVPGDVQEDPEGGVRVGSYGPRSLTSYGGAQGAISILFESRRRVESSLRLADRARRHRIAMEALARYVTGNAAAVTAAVDDGRSEVRRLGREWNAEDSIAIRAQLVSRGREIDYRIAEMRRTPDGAVPTGEVLELRVPLIDSVAAVFSRVRPVGYVIEPHRGDLADHLSLHGLQVERLLAPADVRVESFRVDSVSVDSEPYQGYVPHDVRTTTEAHTLHVPAGTYIVRADQPTATIAFHLLEPEGDDSYATTGELSAELEVGELLPIHRLTELPDVPTELIR